MSQMFDPDPVTGEYECQDSRAEPPENPDNIGQTHPTDHPNDPIDPCGGNTNNGPGCSCEPPF